MTSFLTTNFTAKFQRERRERGRRIREGYDKYAISANKSPYLRNGAR